MCPTLYYHGFLGRLGGSNQETLIAKGDGSAAEIAAAFAKRQVTATYREVELKFMVHDIREEVELKICATLKELIAMGTPPPPHPCALNLAMLCTTKAPYETHKN